MYKIKDKQGNFITFTPNYIQLKHLWERKDHRYVKIVKARQHGITTLYEIDMADEAMWVPGMSCGIIAHRRDKLEEYFEIVHLAYESMPPELRPITRQDTKHKYKFLQMYNGAPLNSSIYVDTDIRGGTVQWLHITEIAYNRDPQALKSGSKQAVPKTGRITEETTGNGMNDFYDEYMDARALQLSGKNGEMDYITCFYAWVENPEYTLPGVLDEKTPDELRIIEIAKREYHIDVTDGQLLWRRWKKRELKQKQDGISLNEDQLFKQEYPLTVQEAFQSGAGSVFDLEKLESMHPLPILGKPQIELLHKRHALTAELYYTPDQLKTILDLQQVGVWFWHLPQPDTEYVIGVDPSDGQGADFGPINVWTRKPDPETGKLKQVAQWYGKLLPDELAQMSASLANLYNSAFVGVENNMIATVSFLAKIYGNLFFEVKMDEKLQKRSKKFGWNTNIQTREKMIDDFEIHYRDDLLEINSPVTLKEMRTFVRKLMPSGAYKREHADGKHDDSLFSDMIAVEMSLYRKPKAMALEEKPF